MNTNCFRQAAFPRVKYVVLGTKYYAKQWILLFFPRPEERIATNRKYLVRCAAVMKRYIKNVRRWVCSLKGTAAWFLRKPCFGKVLRESLNAWSPVAIWKRCFEMLYRSTLPKAACCTHPLESSHSTFPSKGYTDYISKSLYLVLAKRGVFGHDSRTLSVTTRLAQSSESSKRAETFVCMLPQI